MWFQMETISKTDEILILMAYDQCTNNMPMTLIQA